MGSVVSDRPRRRTHPTRVALVDSGFGLIRYAAALRELAPDVALVLAMDPDHMPWGPRSPEQVRRLVLESARATLPYRPDAVVIACNTATVHGLDAVRAELEPHVPVIGTVPAIRPAAAAGGPIAVWATAATTGSDYLRGLVDAFAADVETYPVTAHGLAEAIESADLDLVDACVAAAVARTPAGVRALVLGCTHYGLIADRIGAAVGLDVAIFDSPVAVARQTLRRIEGSRDTPSAGHPADWTEQTSSDAGSPPLVVLLSGRPGWLPAVLEAYSAAAGLIGEPAQRHTLAP